MKIVSNFIHAGSLFGNSCWYSVEKWLLEQVIFALQVCCVLDSLLAEYKRPYEWNDSIQPQVRIGKMSQPF